MDQNMEVSDEAFTVGKRIAESATEEQLSKLKLSLRKHFLS